MVDVDGPAGRDAIRSLGIGATPTVETRRVLHLYPQGDVPNATGVLPQVDVRGAGGLVLGAGSIHPSGDEYRGLLRPDAITFAPLPGKLAKLLKRRRPPARRDRHGPIPAGQRNVTRTRSAGVLVRAGSADDALAAALHALNASRCAAVAS